MYGGHSLHAPLLSLLYGVRREVSGLGHHGYHQGRLLFNQQATLELIITVVPQERADALLAGLRPLLDASSGVMFVTETYVSRPEYFS